MFVQTRWILVVLALAPLAFIGCGDDDEGKTSGSPCTQFESKLRSCSLLTEGEFPCEEPTGDEAASAQCTLNCMHAAPCEELAAMGCETSAPPAGLLTCLQACDGAAGETFACTDGSDNVPVSWKCDGYTDCTDGSDEVGCPMFACADGNGEVPESAKCNYYPECADQSDEAGCPGFTCGDGSVVAESWKCDGEDDCADGTDEVGCPQMAQFVCQ